MDASINKRIQETEERISDAEDTIESIDTTVKKYKMQKAPNPKHLEIQDKIRRPNLRIVGIKEREDFQLKVPVNVFNKIIEENFPNLKMSMNTQEAYRTSNRFD